MVKKINIRFKIIVSLLVSLSLLWGLFFYWYDSKREEEAVSYLLRQAQGIYRTVVLARHWISAQGGIYVKTSGGMELVTPSHFVASLALFARTLGNYRIKIAVENAKNPAHLPDDFERRALRVLEDSSGYWELQKDGKHYLFRYAAPLLFRKECSRCHYSYERENRGCVSVSLLADDVVKVMHRDRVYMGMFSFASLGLVFVMLYFVINRYVIRPLYEFVSVSRRIEEGDLDARVSVSTRDEWEILARSFNSMVDKLANVQRELEERVREAVGELKSAYEELKKTEQYRSEFFSNVTHDLKTPITAIKGIGELMVRKGGDFERYGRMLLRNGEKLLRMVDDILDCTRIDYGKFQLELAEEDICQLVEDAVLVVLPIAEVKGVRVEMPCCEGIVARVDGHKLFRAIVNLLDNAVKFSPEGGVVSVEVRRDGGDIIVSVEDQGEGVKEKDRVFEKFYKGEGGGLGLGLFVVKKVAEAHGGKVWVEDVEGGGSRFCIFIPEGPDEAKDTGD